MRPRRASLCATAVFLGWLGWSGRPFWSFALGHPSAFGAWTLLHLLDAALLQPALAALLFLGARGLGELLLGGALPDGLGEERPLFACALGLGALALLIAAGGAAGWSRGVSLGVWAGLLALAAAAPRARRPASGARSAAEVLGLCVVAAAALCAWIQAVAPPTSWDALAYHLEVPKRWLLGGRVGFTPSLYIAKNPLLPEVLYLPALGIGRDTLAQLIHLGFALLCAAAVLAYGRRRRSARAGALAAAVFACQPLFGTFAGTANTDFTVCFFGFLSVWALEEWAPRGRRRWLVLSGLLAGLACASKIIGLWLAAALAVTLAARLALEGGAAADFLAWAGAGAAAAAPWYALNWLWLGDPVWPYFARLFGAGAPAQALFVRLRASVTEGVAPTLGHLIALPYLLVFRGPAFWYSPQVLAAPVLLSAAWLLARRRAPGLSRTVGAFCALYGLLWFFVYQGWRYAVLVVPWGCLLVGAALDDAWSAGRAPRAAAAAVLGTLAALMLAGQSPSNELFALSAARPSNGLSSRDRYLSLSLDQYDLFAWADANLAPGAKVLLYGEMRPYYLRHESFLGDPLNDFRVGYAGLSSPAELEARLRALGVTHVAARPDAAAFQGDQAYYRRADALMQALLRDRATVVRRSGGLTLFELKRP